MHMGAFIVACLAILGISVDSSQQPHKLNGDAIFLGSSSSSMLHRPTSTCILKGPVAATEKSRCHRPLYVLHTHSSYMPITTALCLKNTALVQQVFGEGQVGQQ